MNSLIDTKIKHVTSFIPGFGFPEELQGQTEGDIPFLKVSDINGEMREVSEAANCISQQTLFSNGWKTVPVGAIAMAKIGAALSKNHRKVIKKPAVIDNNMMAAIPTKIDPDYFYWLWRTIDLTDFQNVSSVPSVNMTMLKNFELKIPETRELQKKVADFLDQKVARIDEAIAKKKKLVSLLEEKRSTSITQAITKGLDKRVKLKDSNISWLGKIPNHWEIKKLKFIGKTIIGLTFDPTDIVSNENEGTALLRANNIANGKINRDDIVYVKTSVPNKLITKESDILICSRSGSRDLIGKCAKIDSKTAGAAFGVFMTVFRSKHNDYIYYVLNSNIFKFQTGRFLTSTINQLTQATLNGFEVPFPPKEEQKEIVEYLNEVTQTIEKAKSKIKESIELLEEYKTSLISNAVTGKVKI